MGFCVKFREKKVYTQHTEHYHQHNRPAAAQTHTHKVQYGLEHKKTKQHLRSL